MLHVSWRNKIPKKTIRERTSQEELQVCIIRRKRLTWLGHVARMNKNRRAKQVINWTPGGKRGRGRWRENWTETIRENLRELELTWEDMLSRRRRKGKGKGKGIQVLYSDIFALTLLRVTRLHHRLSV